MVRSIKVQKFVQREGSSLKRGTKKPRKPNGKKISESFAEIIAIFVT